MMFFERKKGTVLSKPGELEGEISERIVEALATVVNGRSVPMR